MCDTVLVGMKMSQTQGVCGPYRARGNDRPVQVDPLLPQGSARAGHWVRRGRKLIFAGAAMATYTGLVSGSASAEVYEEYLDSPSTVGSSGTSSFGGGGESYGGGGDNISWSESPAANSSTETSFDMFGTSYDSKADAQVADLTASAHSTAANQSFDFGGNGETTNSLTNVPAGVYQNPYGTAVVGTSGDDNVVVERSEQTDGYQVTINDEVFALGSDDLTMPVVAGLGGRDTIVGSNLPELFVGGVDKDIIKAGGGADVVLGGSGDDEIYPGAGDDIALGGAGNDRIDETSYTSGWAMFDGDDKLSGGTGDDLVRGGNGSDFLKGDGGDDILEGNNGRDTIAGDDGNDVIYGGRFGDNISGGPGNDYLDGGRGNDRLTGGDGADILAGGFGGDTLIGGFGDDTVITGIGYDNVIDHSGDADTVYLQSIDQVASDGADELVLVPIDPDLAEDQLPINSQDKNFIDRVESDLATLRSFPTGKELLTDIEASGKTVSIAEAADPRSRSSIGKIVEQGQWPYDDEIDENGAAGPGMHSVINYATSRPIGDDMFVPITVLGHELVHGEQMANGVVDPGISVEIDNDGNPRLDSNGDPIFSSDSELQATGLPYHHGFQSGAASSPAHLTHDIAGATDNKIRADLNLPPREQYASNSDHEVADNPNGGRSNFISPPMKVDKFYDAFGNPYYDSGLAQTSDLVSESQAVAANLESGVRSDGQTTLGLTNVDAGVYRNYFGTVVVGTTGKDNLAIVRNPESGTYSADINGYSIPLTQRDVDTLVIAGNGGGDTITGSDLPETVLGGDSIDDVDSGAGDDSIFVGRGDDSVRAGAGNDLVIGGRGDDIIRGGNGNDLLVGMAGEDLLQGNSGDDALLGSSGDDVIYGGLGNDRLSGQAGADYIDGGRGEDQLWGDAGDDILSGGVGDDRLKGGPGNDTILTGVGSDSFVNTAGDADTLYLDRQDRGLTDAGDSIRSVSQLPSLAHGQLFVTGDTTNQNDLDFIDRVDSDLMTLRSFTNGQELLESIQESGKIITIKEAEDPRRNSKFSQTIDMRKGENLTDAELDENGEPGPGVGGTVTYGVASGPEAPVGNVPLVEFSHELIHASHAANGIMDPGRSVGLDAEGNPIEYVDGKSGDRLYPDDEELHATGLPYDKGRQGPDPTTNPADLDANTAPVTENTIREALNIDKREVYHDGKTPIAGAAIKAGESNLVWPSEEESSSTTSATTKSEDARAFSAEDDGSSRPGSSTVLERPSDKLESQQRHPACQAGSESDSDGDGFGWEHEKTCVVR